MSRIVTKAEHPLAAVLLHWAHLASFVALACTGLAIQALPEAAKASSRWASIHDGVMPAFVLTAIMRVVWAFLGDGSANRGEERKRSDWRHFVLHKGDLRVARAWMSRYLGGHVEAPEPEKYNPLQKVVYAVLFPLGIVVLALTGLALHPAYSELVPWVPRLLGGETGARIAHTIAMWTMIALTAMHLYAAVKDGGSRIALILFRVTPKGDVVQEISSDTHRDAA